VGPPSERELPWWFPDDRAEKTGSDKKNKGKKHSSMKWEEEGNAKRRERRISRGRNRRKQTKDRKVLGTHDSQAGDVTESRETSENR